MKCHEMSYSVTAILPTADTLGTKIDHEDDVGKKPTYLVVHPSDNRIPLVKVYITMENRNFQ